jgi:plastocyanin
MKTGLRFASLLTLAMLILAACQAAPSATQAADTAQPAAPSGGTGKAVEILIQSFAFNPATVTVAAGTEVKWTNEDAPGHTILSDDGTTIKSPTLNKGDSFSMVFNTPGTYSYYCSIHPSMKGTIVVTQ